MSNRPEPHQKGGKGMENTREILQKQIEFLAELSKKDTTSVEEVVKCSETMASLYKALTNY